MTSHDIEQMLRQYGDNQRQQRLIADHVRGLARRQARRRAVLLGSLAAVALVGLAVFLLQPSPQPTLIAEDRTSAHTMPDGGNMPSVSQAPLQSLHDSTSIMPLRQHSVVSQQSDGSLFAVSNPVVVGDTVVAPVPPATHEAAGMIVQTVDTFATQDKVFPSHPVSYAEVLKLESPDAQSVYDDKSPLMPDYDDSRFHFAYAVGTSTVGNAPVADGASQYSLDYIDALSSSIPAGSNFRSAVTSANSLHTSVSVDYCLVRDNRCKLTVGVGVSGYLQQNSFYVQDERAIPAVSNAGFDVMSSGPVTNITEQQFISNTVGLFVGLPLTFDFHPSGIDRLGWSVGLTPAHSAYTANYTYEWEAGDYTTTLNPWKLTLSLGVALPRNLIHRVSLTANLLPLYTTRSLHEFGITVGF